MRKRISPCGYFTIAGTAVLLLCVWYSPAQAQAQGVEYVKVCDPYGTGYYYIPGTDTCLKLGGYVKFEQLPTGTQAPAPPAGCSDCAELDEQIAKLTERFNKLEGKGVPAWQEDIASDIATLRNAKTACQKTCGPPPAQTTGESVKVCDTYGAGFYYIPGTDSCLKFSGTARYDWKDVPKNTTAPPPPAGCQICGALDAEIKSLEADYKALDGKSGDAVTAQRQQLDAQITKLQGLKAGCQKVCTATPPRTAKKKKTPGEYYQKQPPPLRTLTPPSRAKNPPGVPSRPSPPDRERNQSG